MGEEPKEPEGRKTRRFDADSQTCVRCEDCGTVYCFDHRPGYRGRTPPCPFCGHQDPRE